MRFEIGRLCATGRVAADMAARPSFAGFVKSCIDRYVIGDWGDVSEADHSVTMVLYPEEY